VCSSDLADQPEAIWNRRHLCLGRFRPDVCAESLEEWLEKQEEAIQAIAAGYLGVEDRQGQWTEEALEAARDFEDKLSDALASRDIVARCAPEDYFGYMAEDEIAKEAMADSSYVQTAVDEARENGVLLDYAEVYRYVEDVVCEYQESL